ncbi:MAG: AI-2E family transporter [Reyranellaceae bacterium]
MIDTERGRAEVSRFVIDLAVRIALIAGVVYVSVLLLRPVVPLMLWAVILAVAVSPLFVFLNRRLRLPSGLAAAVLSIFLLALLLVPVVLLAASAVETLEAYAKMLVKGDHVVPPPAESIRSWPVVGPRLYDFWKSASEDTRALVTGHVNQITSAGRFVGGLAAGMAMEVLQFATAIIVSGVLLAYSGRLVGMVDGLANRITASRGKRFIEIAGATIRNVSQGVIGVALLQAALLGVGMLVAGVPFAGAITFGALVLAIVQVGPGIIMLPVLVWAWFTFPIVSAAVFTVYTVPLLLLDNILRPLVMARGLQTPMVIILAGVICGTLAGGLIGLFVGPVVLSVFYDLVSAWMREPPEGPPLAPRAGGNPTSTGGLAMSNSDGSTTIRRAMPGCGS